MKVLNIIRWVLVTVIAVMTIIAVWQLAYVNPESRSFADSDFPETIVVENTTDYKLDTICMHLAYSVLGLDTANIIMVYIPEHIGEDEIDSYTTVQYLPFRKNQFIILFPRVGLSPEILREALCHEFVHIHQYLTGDLTMYPQFAIWKGEDVYFGEIPYAERPFEKEAYRNQGKYLKKLNKVLY